MGRVIHFEIFAEDPARSIRFYRELFDWSFTPDANHADYWHVVTGDKSTPGINGGLTKPYLPRSAEGVGAFVATIEVAALEGYAERIVAAGGSLVKQPFEIEGYGRMLHASDPEGNLFGLIEKQKR